MMRGVQDAPPEDPDPFAVDVKERDDCEPPFLVLVREKFQTVARELNHTRRKRLRRAILRQNFVRRYLRQSQKLAEEPALRQQLVFDDLSNSARAGMWFECEIVFGEFVPDRMKLVCFARVSPHDVLKDWRRSLRHLIILDSNVFVVHNTSVHKKHKRSKGPKKDFVLLCD